MKKIYQYILLVVAMVATASCSNELDDTLQPVENGTLQFVVGDFPAFGEDPQTRASSFGTPDEGKTAWETNDEITVIFTSEYYGEQTATLTYGEDGTWVSSGTLSYLENETPAVSAVYNPCADTPGLGEYLTTTDCTLANNALSINFEDATRTYSRLRIATLADLPLAVTTTGFTPAGAEEAGEHSYTITADKKGNAYLYGTFAEGATVSVKQGDVTLKDYTFTAEKNPNGTEYNKSYALDATPVIDGTLGGKTEATEDDITALVEQLKEYVDNGITTIIVLGSQPAMIDVGSYTTTAIGEAIYRLSGSDYYDENNPYNGKIDLILQDVTEIVDQEFYSAWALNSITLPKVIKIGDMAFQGCDHLTKLTFGSVLTTIDEHDGLMFWVGEKVDGCDLFLNCGQMNSQYVPDLATNTWTILHTNEFKSITLTHTGENSECDECKANQ
nr:hypothetical protein [Caudoviricetes sp.]